MCMQPRMPEHARAGNRGPALFWANHEQPGSCTISAGAGGYPNPEKIAGDNSPFDHLTRIPPEKRAFRKAIRLRFESGRRSYSPWRNLALAFTDWCDRDDEMRQTLRRFPRVMVVGGVHWP